MTDDLLPFYDRELAFLRRFGAEFAEAHPKIAGRLRLGPDVIEDPHVSRLIEAVALLNARVRQKLDDDFPELTQSLLSILHPHFLAPIPSMAIVQFVPKDSLTARYDVPSGASVESLPVDGEPCRFRTCGDAVLWPFEVESAKLTGRPILSPHVPAFASAAASLRLVLRTRAPSVEFGALAPPSLRFHLRGPHPFAAKLYELLLNDLVGIAVASGPDDAHPVLLEDDALTPGGFAPDEALLPCPPAAFPGYRLLTEFFAFPQKFLFVDLALRVPPTATDRIEIHFYLKKSAVEVEQNLATDTFALGCAPIVNLYPHRAEPIELNQTRAEHRVVPDARRPLSTEVYSIDRVTAIGPDGAEESYAPFFSVRHASRDASRRRFYLPERRPSAPVRGAPVSGADVFLSVVDLDLRPSAPQDWVLAVDTTCLNRDLPSRLPFGGDQPRMQLGEGAAPLETVRCLTQPTPTLRPDAGRGRLWRLVSHLSLGHLSLAGGEDAAQALREILSLHDVRDTAETRATVDGVVSVRSRDSTARAPSRRGVGICRGTEIRAEFDPARYSNDLFLFAQVLERFFAAYCTVNSFTRTVAVVRGREGELRRWPPRAGEKTLL